jgi:signal transduction histidine kinase
MIEQVAINLNYDNNRLQAALDAFFQHKDVKKHLFKTNFNNAIEEIQYEQRLWDLFELKLLSSIDGNFSIVQFDKKSIITKSNYKVSNYASNDYKIDEISLKNDPLFLCLKNNPKKNLAIGMLRKGTIIGYESEKKPVLLYPIRDEKNNIVKVAIIIQPLNYYTKLYSHLERLKMGTLFVSDDFGNIMFANHPSSQDDFEFDTEKREYINNGIFRNGDTMSFTDYSNLVLDFNIINQPEILKFMVDSGLKSPFLRDSRSGIRHISLKYQNRKYFAVGRVDSENNIKYLFIIPEYHVVKAAKNFLFIILFFSGCIFLFLILIITVSYWKVIIPIEKKYVGLEEKNFYFMNLAHEIKTPMTLIRNYLDLYIKKTGSTDELNVISLNINKIEKDMINILDCRKLEEGKIIYDHKQISNLSDILHLKEKLYIEAAAKKQIILNYHVEENVYLWADPLSLDRIINNLIDNAIKYTPNGGKIDIKLEKIKGHKIELSVKDTGVGIAKKDQRKVFSPYFQIMNSEGTSNGVGLGMFITYGIIKELKGSININSDTNGNGTCFTVRLHMLDNENLKNYHSPTSDSKLLNTTAGNFPIFENYELHLPNPSPEHFNIMILEDNIDLSYYMATSLKDSYNLYFANNGKEGIRLLEEIKKPDLIISDMMMPELDGYEFLNYVSNHDNFKDIPFIFLSAASDSDNKIKAFLSGAVDFIAKPFSIEILKARINALLNYQKIKKELHEKDKYITMGMLLGGISHEIFNPLLGIYAPLENLELLFENIENDSYQQKGLKYIKNIETNIVRIENVVKSLKVLYYNRDFERTKIDLNEILDSIANIFASKMPADKIKFTTIVPNNFQLEANHGVLTQILMNLIKNSIDALDNIENGEIKVEAFVSPKRSYLSVSDNGKGIDKENLDLIFNAFFTTKDVGKGTGLGLYLVKDLANKMGWQIDVSSEVGKGTEFKIFFI